MRFRRRPVELLEGDLTPFVDMTFQLIAFFMLLINFSNVEKVEEIELPDSVLARPPETPPEYQIILNLHDDGSVLFSGQLVQRIDLLRPLLNREINVASREGVPQSDINVIIRSDRDTPHGLVQQLMAKCQESELQMFSLRVNERIE
jgi:biopolymer transport protein ExbD